VEEFGAESRTECVQAIAEPALEFIWTHYAIAGSSERPGLARARSSQAYVNEITRA
jgi:hypothetical protein